MRLLSGVVHCGFPVLAAGLTPVKPPLTLSVHFEQGYIRMAKPMSKAELVADIAMRGDISKAQADEALKAVVAAISAQLVAGNTVALPGLAKFETRERPARLVRNVATGEMMEKAADRAVKITALTGIKSAVNGGQ